MIQAPVVQTLEEDSGGEPWTLALRPAVCVILLALAVLTIGFGVWPSGPASDLLDFRMTSLGFSGLALATGLIGLVVVLSRPRQRTAKAGLLPYHEASPAPGGRERFLTNLAQRITSHSEAGPRLALHLIDIDRFRRLNALLGEAAGDAFLQDVTEKLRLIVENAEDLARIGDDEFALIQVGADGARHTEIFARRIRNALDDACAEVPTHARPGASIGAALFPEHAGDPVQLLQCASAGLELAKRNGGGQFRLYSTETAAAADERLDMEQAIREGLKQEWFDLLFQPQYDLHTRRLVGFEAMARLNHPERGELLPDDFIPVAEEIGLIQPLGAWIIAEALAAAADWPVHLTLSINVSAAQFHEGDVAETIVQALAKSCFEGTRLHVEISEGLLWQASESVRQQLRRLRRRGVRLVLDDFGIESSQLQALVRSTCDAVKLDRSFVGRVGTEPEANAVVRGLIKRAEAFDLPVLAEGVERAEQAHFLMSHSCHKVQGFLFGEPTHSRDLAALVAKDLRNGLAQRELEAASPDTRFHPSASRAASRMSR
jgi:diguanylate cyclase (GGDEF)-like protein